MQLVSNVRIGTKLALMSGFGIVLVAVMLAGSIYGNFRVKSANEAAALHQTIVREVKAIEFEFLQTLLAVRNIRLATTRAQMSAADTLADHQSNIDKLFSQVLPRFTSPDNRLRAQKIQAAISQYISSALTEIIPVKSQAIALEGTDNPLLPNLTAETERIQLDRLDPVSDKATRLLDDLSNSARDSAAEAAGAAAAAMAFAQQLTIGLGAAVIFILFGSAVFGAASIARPLRSLIVPLQEVAAGNFAVTIPNVGRKDEVGLIAAAVEAVVDQVGATISNIKLAASEVTSASAEISTSTTDLSQRTEEQAASLEETTASMEEIAETVKRNAESAREANAFAIETSAVAERGGAVVGNAVTAMARIEESSRKISDIIGVIDEIARQTNLLALNAAVEAARAGDAGRGFAVVASEVRSLAQRSSQAAKDIKDLIVNSNSQVKDGVDLVNKAGQSLAEIVASIKKVATIVAAIANASAEQSSGIEQVNKALSQMDEVTQQNSALVEENAATAKTLEHQAKSMDQRVAAFRLRAEATRDADAESAASTIVEGRRAPRTCAVRCRAAPPERYRQSRDAQAVVPPKRRRRGGPVGRMQTALATALNADADWKEF